MPKYLVINPWFGVEKGAVIDVKEINPAFLPNVEEVGESDVKLVTASEPAKANRKSEIQEQLKELGVKFDGRTSVEDLEIILSEELAKQNAAE